MTEPLIDDGAPAGALQRRAAPWAACLLALPLMLAPVTPAAAAWEDFRLRVDATVEHTDNLLHYSDFRLDQFDSGEGPAGRFDGIESTDDIVTRLRVRTNYDWELQKRGDLRVWLNGVYFLHARNDIADYGQPAGGVTWDVTKRDRLDLAVKQTIDRFKKNYRSGDTLRFEHAHYDQTDATIGYTRALRKKGRWDLGIDYTNRRRRYNHGFEGRDQDGDYVLLRTSYRMSEKARAETALGYGEVDSATQFDGELDIDRSYDQFQAIQKFRFELPAGFDLRLALKYRRRDYSTAEVEDLGRYDRVDDYYRAGIRLDKGWKNGLAIQFRVAYIDNNSDRLDPDIEVDEAGYDEFTGGVGLSYRF